MFALPVLLGEAAKAAAVVTDDKWPPGWLIGLEVCGLLFIALILPFLLGNMIARSLRMADYGWKIGLILLAVFSSVVLITPKPKYLGIGWPPKLGVDLNGGAILVYNVDVTSGAASKVDGDKNNEDAGKFSMDQLIAALTRRLNPVGTKEIVIRPFGARSVEIIVPEVDSLEIDEIKKNIATAGILEFLIVAIRADHESLIDIAQQQSQDALDARSRIVKDENGRVIGYWAGVPRGDQNDPEFHNKFKVAVWGWTIRDPRTGQFIQLPQNVIRGFMDKKQSPEDYFDKLGITNIEVLMKVGGDKEKITGADLGMVSVGADQLRYKVDFSTKNALAARKMGYLTESNLSDTSVQRYLGIVLDGNLLSAPAIRGVISDNGQITGDFTESEANFLVGILRAGQLPKALEKLPASDNRIDSTLGTDTIIKSAWAIGFSLLAVLLFMVWYYRFSGLVACFVLIVNLMMTIALMMLIKAPFTLPGLAGLVLTVGMAVDANVLIYERMREEAARGAALRMVIRNGFDRALTTIIDSNLTTIITAVVLYVIGTDQIKGFAVSLTLGLLTSMFTAVFCSRVIFDIAERRRWLTELKMRQFIETPNFDYMRVWKLFTFASIVLIVVGLGAVYLRGKGMLDIDLSGGTSVQPVLREARSLENMRKALDDAFSKAEPKVPFTLSKVKATGDDAVALADKMYKIDTALTDKKELEAALKKTLTDDSGKSLIATYSMSFTAPKVKAASADAGNDDKTSPEQPATEKSPTADTEPNSKPADDLKKVEPASDNKVPDAKTSEEKSTEGESNADEPPPSGKPTDSAKPDQSRLDRDYFRQLLALADDAVPPADDAKKESSPSADNPVKEKPASETTAAEPAPEVKTADVPSTNNPEAKEPTRPVVAAIDLVETTLTFSTGISQETILEQLKDVAASLQLPAPEVTFTPVSGKGDNQAHKEWLLQVRASAKDTTAMLESLQTKLAATPVFRSSSEIGGQVAGDSQSRAIYALFASFLGIILYIWVRFNRVIWGVAAVLALVHDVLMTIGAVAISYWLAPMLGFLMVEEFKINLTMVAAILTLVGYSINDTIVTFDRIREVKGKSPNLTNHMINLSINQTLSRTILTALTVFMVVLVLYILGGESIHGFAFSLVIGTIVGSYSSIFIAAPILLWMSEPEEVTKTESSANEKKTPVA